MTDTNLLKQSLMNFFSKKRLSIVADVLDQKKNFSLRVVEYFINSYSRRKSIKYKVRNKTFEVYNSYKNEQMKSFSKKHFDLFRRTDRIKLNVGEGRIVDTTIAQLNFFKWAIENDILLYVEKNIVDIRKDMNIHLTKKPVPQGKKTKISDNITIHNNKIIISFD